MLTQDHLTLRSVCLKSLKEWTHRQEGIVFILVREGAGKYTAGRRTQYLAPGDVLVTNASKEGKLTADNAGKVMFGCFFVRLEHLYPLFGAEEVSLLEPVTEELKDLRVYTASSSVAKECHQLLSGVTTERNLQHRSQLLRVAALVLAEEFRTARRQRVGFVRADEHMLQVLQSLSADELLEGSVEDLAAKFGCGRRHLNRLFHQYFGFSVAAMKMDMRMLKAMSLLRNPDAKVLTIAEQCGFNHLGLFNTCFKKRFGFSPTQWRKQIAETENVAPASAEVNSDSLPAAKGDREQERITRTHAVEPSKGLPSVSPGRPTVEVARSSPTSLSQAGQHPATAA